MSCTLEERVLLEQMAELRADQTSWEAIAEKLNRPLDDLHRVRVQHTRTWKKLLTEARREWLAGVNQEAMIAVLNVINQPENPQELLKAANIYARLAHTQEKLTNPTRPKSKPKPATNTTPKEPVPKEQAKTMPKPGPSPSAVPTRPQEHAKPRPTIGVGS